MTIPFSGPTAPAGAVTVTDSLRNTVTVPASSCTVSGKTLVCTANLPTTNEPVGANSVTVSQASDANYGGSTGSGTVTIAKATVTTGDLASGAGTYGAATTAVTVSIPYAGTVAPAGSITVTDSHSETVTIQASGCSASGGVLTCTANLPTANEPVGSNAVAVNQVADANYSGSTGSGSVSISKAVATGGDTATGTGTYGAATTPVRISIPYVGATAPTGVITLADTHNNSVTVQAPACTAAGGVLSCTANLPYGRMSLRAAMR